MHCSFEDKDVEVVEHGRLREDVVAWLTVVLCILVDLWSGGEWVPSKESIEESWELFELIILGDGTEPEFSYWTET